MCIKHLKPDRAKRTDTNKQLASISATVVHCSKLFIRVFRRSFDRSGSFCILSYPIMYIKYIFDFRTESINLLPLKKLKFLFRLKIIRVNLIRIIETAYIRASLRE